MPLPLSGPIIQAPMSGGASTPELVAAVSAAGGLGFLAAGYLPTDRLAEQLAGVRERGSAPFGVNVFVPSADDADPAALAGYAARLAPEESRYGVPLGQPRWSDEEWADKLALLEAQPPALVSFTFGCPTAAELARLRAAGTAVAVTVTSAGEARAAVERGVDAVFAQGVEAGGHRGGWIGAVQVPLAELLPAVLAAVDVPVVAAGGIGSRAQVAAALDAGATAVAVGTAFLRCHESGATELHQQALVDPGSAGTTLTRAFTGRLGRVLVNRFVQAYDPVAATGYPNVHYLTQPVRAAAAAARDPGGMSLFAGTGHASAQRLPAAELIRELSG